MRWTFAKVCSSWATRRKSHRPSSGLPNIAIAARRTLIGPHFFYINRAGKNLSAARKLKLERAKTELKRLFGKG
jgi:hypothetical protein